MEGSKKLFIAGMFPSLTSSICKDHTRGCRLPCSLQGATKGEADQKEGNPIQGGQESGREQDRDEGQLYRPTPALQANFPLSAFNR